MKLTSTVAISNSIDRSGRIYTKETLYKILKDFKEGKCPLFGELGPVNEKKFSILNVSHKVKSISIKKERLPRKEKKFLKKNNKYLQWKQDNKDYLIVSADILNTDNGRIIKEMIEKTCQYL